jgi:hypothetical protein
VAPGPDNEDAMGTEHINANLKFCLHPDDPANFLKLSTALIILTKTSITSEELVVANNLLWEYCTELIMVTAVLLSSSTNNELQLYGPAVIKPNHHYATHITSCLENFGPIQGFWTFLFEQLNCVLKSFKTNNHANGELEMTFFHEFQRTCQSACIVSAASMMTTLKIFRDICSSSTSTRLCAKQSCPDHAKDNQQRARDRCITGHTLSRVG